MNPEKVLIERIKQFCLSNSYLDGCSQSYCDGLDVAKTIILDKIKEYENHRIKVIRKRKIVISL